MLDRDEGRTWSTEGEVTGLVKRGEDGAATFPTELTFTIGMYYLP